MAVSLDDYRQHTLDHMGRRGADLACIRVEEGKCLGYILEDNEVRGADGKIDKTKLNAALSDGEGSELVGKFLRGENVEENLEEADLSGSMKAKLRKLNGKNLIVNLLYITDKIPANKGDIPGSDRYENVIACVLNKWIGVYTKHNYQVGIDSNELLHNIITAARITVDEADQEYIKKTIQMAQKTK